MLHNYPYGWVYSPLSDFNYMDTFPPTTHSRRYGDREDLSAKDIRQQYSRGIGIAVNIFLPGSACKMQFVVHFPKYIAN